MNFGRQKQQIIQIAILCATVILVGKAAHLQLIDTSLHNRAKTATLYKKTLYPSRGLIYDRNDKLLVVNQPLYDLKTIYSEIDPTMDTLKFCELLEISIDDFKANLDKDWKDVRFHRSIPFTFLDKIDPSSMSKFQEHLYEFPGFYPILRNVRSYPYPNAAHVLGYLNEVDQKSIDSSQGVYSLGDYSGVSGLECKYEDLLRGVKGVKYVLKDNLGREVGNAQGELVDSSATAGMDLVSSIDIDLQAYGESLFKNKKGSIVAIEPSTGEILAMVSAPSYDPNTITINKNRSKAVVELLNDTLQPLLDRSFMAQYPPGSIFKTVLSLIALQEGTTYIDRTINCNGSYRVNNSGFSQGCHNHPTPHGIAAAIQYSCNSYYYQVLRELIEKEGYTRPGVGLNILGDYLDKFGLGRKLGVDIMYENRGFFPRPDYYDKLYASAWRSTYMLSIGIGQGELELTTVQMANLAAIMANRGYYITPHLLKTVKGHPDLTPTWDKNTIPVDAKYFDVVVEGMQRVVTSGTGYVANVPGLDICGKTGTSQNSHGKDHSVFFAFAPKDNPKIAIAVYVENGGFGATNAGPIASFMIEKYLTGEVNLSRKWLEEQIIERNIIDASSP